MNLFTKQKYCHRCRKQTYGYQGGKEGINCETGIDICESETVSRSVVSNSLQVYGL